MILDRLENAGLYRPMSANLALAMDYICKTDFSKEPTGRKEIDGDRVIAIVQRFQPKLFSQMVWEGHRNYIDVQCVVSGVERMGYVPLSDQLSVRQAYDAEKDLVLFDANGQFFNVYAGSFAIFAPNDIHAPCLAAELPEVSGEVCKVIMKVRV